MDDMDVYYGHPLFHPLAFHLDTPAQHELREFVQRLLWTGAAGGTATGRARDGKTTALKHLMGSLETRAGKTIPCYYVSIPARDMNTIASVHRVICRAQGLSHTRQATADVLSSLFIHHVADTAAETGCDCALLIVDEMQRLGIRQLDAFAELYDVLKDMGVAMTTLFTGNDPECWSVIKHVEDQNLEHIRGRFFTEGATFTGLTSAADVRFCLKQYDTLRYPADGPTYTEYFLPARFKQGWRVASLASDLWAAFRIYQRDYKLRSWGMKYFTAAISILLADLIEDDDQFDVDDEVLDAAIQASGLVRNLVSPR